MTETQKRIIEYGKKIDQFTIEHNYEKLNTCLSEMELFVKNEAEAVLDPSSFYFLGTGYGIYSDYIVRTGKKYTDSDVIELRRRSMYYFRRAYFMLGESDVTYDNRLQLRILTNYANELDTVGRVIEALRVYRKVLMINENFAIARGNYGKGLQFLANLVNDSGHYKDIHCFAYQAIKQAVSIEDQDMHEQAIEAFQKIIANYETIIEKEVLNNSIAYKEYSLGNGKEAEYREWCLTNHLFLNPMNDVIDIYSAFAHDPLTITTYTEDIHHTDSVTGNTAEPPRWFAMLNQLKEEYVYARYLCYEGMEKYQEVHFADKEVKLSLGSYDYSNYSIRIEQLKSAFKNLYSMLDQICFFINDFWQLGLKERNADAYNVCKSKKYPKDNVALTSLYWVLCEFYEKYGGAENASEKELTVLRNAIEHKFIKVHEYGWNRELYLENDGFYHVSEHKLKKSIMRLLELAREALMYLVYAIGVNDSQKQKEPENAVTMPILDYSDEWKR